MSDLKNVQPLADFNWDEFENGSNANVSKQDLEKAYDETLNKVSEHQVVDGTVISIDKKEVIVNIGYKSDGIIPASEFRYNPELKVGDTVEVYVENQEDKKGQLVLSHKKARLSKSWERVNAALENEEVIQGYIKCRTKGGMIVDVFGIEAFLPGSQIDVHPIRDYDVFVGKTMEFKVVKINQEFRNVVVSHKALIEAELEAQKKEIISKLEKGQILEGTVKNITSYGVFVDLGGVDGLITMFSRDTQLKVEFGEDDFPAASTDKVVGEDGYQPAGKAFDWDFDIDHYAEKFVAVVDLSTCTADAEKENVASIGTDINAWFSNVANAGNIHLYYTPATKTLTCCYISSNASYGAWKYSKELTDIEGEINIDFSYQYGLRINGQQVFDAGQLIKLYYHNTLHFGSQEGSTRSNATYKSARVVKTAFEATDATEYTAPAKMLLDGKYSRFEAAQISLQATDYDVYTIILKDLSHNGKYLGSLKFTNIKGYLAEGSGDNSSSFIVINDTTANAVLETAGELASSLGLTKGQEIRASIKDLYGQTSFLAGDFTMQLGDKEAVYSYYVDTPAVNEYTNTLTTTFSSEEQSYTDKVMTVTNYGDGFADIMISNVQFKTTGDANMGNLIIKEVPYTKQGGDIVIDANGLEATFENSPSTAMTILENVSLKGTIAGEELYFEINGMALSDMPVSLVFGKPITPAVVYTGTMKVTSGEDYKEIESATITVRPNGDNKYTFCVPNIGGEDAITFVADGETDENGVTTYSAEKAEYAMQQSGWEGYITYVTLTRAKSQGDKFYGRFFFDLGGYAESYPSYGVTVVFGEKFTPTGIETATEDTTITDIYSADGVRQNQLQKGLNIVRQANGKTTKIIIK